MAAPRARGAWAGQDRRRAARRRADLPRRASGWELALCAALGAAVGLGLQVARDRGGQVHAAALVPAHALATPGSPAERAEALEVDGERVPLRQWSDEAAELTVAAVALDEQAHERWLPRLAELEALDRRSDLSDAAREQLDGLLRELERVGLRTPAR